MACGLPVVASGVGGIPDLVVPGETGILIDPRRSDQIREALRSVIVNASRRKEMGLKVGHHAKTYFSIDRINSLNVQCIVRKPYRPNDLLGIQHMPKSHRQRVTKGWEAVEQ